MQKQFTTLNQSWYLQEEIYEFPPKCLSCTIKNDGDILVLIDDVIQLKPGRAYTIPAISGYHLTGGIRIKTLNIVAPYSKHTKVIFRNAVEIIK